MEYQLKSWKVQIENKAKENYHFVCDGESLVIVDSFKDFILFIQENQKGNLILERLPYYIQHEIFYKEKCLCLTIL